MRRNAYLLVHGINTKRKEVDQHYHHFLASGISHGSSDEADTYLFNYGMFPIWIFAFPFLRKLVMRPIINLMVSRIESLSKQYKNLTIIAHSNGSSIVWQALEKATNIENDIYLVSLGGIIKCDYDFRKLFSKVRKVLNYCSTADKTVHYLPRLVGKGSSGYYGFRYRPTTTKGKGSEANTGNPTEDVWIPRDIYKDHYPKVTNYRFFKRSDIGLRPTPDHNGWLKPVYITNILREVAGSIADESTRSDGTH